MPIVVLLHYKLVIPVGGDGTLSSLVNYMCDELLLIVPPSNNEEEEQGPCLEQVMQQLPLMGYIPMSRRASSRSGTTRATSTR